MNLPDDWTTIAIRETREHGECRSFRARGGGKVRVYAEDHAGPFHVTGMVREDTRWLLATWNGSGCFAAKNVILPKDIVPAPRSGEVWVVVFGDGPVTFVREDDARHWAQRGEAVLAGPIRVKWTEGQSDGGLFGSEEGGK